MKMKAQMKMRANKMTSIGGMMTLEETLLLARYEQNKTSCACIN